MFERDGQEIQFGRVRYLEEPPQGFLGPTKPLRYQQPSRSPVFAYFPPGDWGAILKDASKPLIIVEGEFKALVAWLHGFPTIGLGGVFNFMRDGAFLSELDAIEWKKRIVYIIFDSDAASNVKRQPGRAAPRRAAIEARGCRSYPATPAR